MIQVSANQVGICQRAMPPRVVECSEGKVRFGPEARVAGAGGRGPGAQPKEEDGPLLPMEGVKALSDRLTQYMTEIGLAGTPEAIEQVLDDFLTQCGILPEELDAPDALDQVVNAQLSVTLAYQLGRLSGRAPHLVERFLREAVERWGAVELDDVAEVKVEDFANMAERVLPKLRRWRRYLGRG